MDDNKQPKLDENKTPDTPPAGDVPPVPPVPTDTPPLPPISPDEVKVPSQPLPKSEVVEDGLPKKEEKLVEPQLSPTPEPVSPVEKLVDVNPTTPELPKPEAPVEPQSKSEPMPVPEKKPKKEEGVEEKPIEAPKKEEMPVEAEFPGQPLPKNQQQNLEKKAKEMIDKDGGVKKRKVEVVGKPKGNVKKTLVGMLLFVLLGAGAFAGNRLIGTNTENRSQAGGGSDEYCPPKLSDECGIGSCKTNNLQFCTKDPYRGCNWTCEDTDNRKFLRINCCNGEWVTWRYNPNEYGESEAKTKACVGRGGWKDCDVPVTQCTCESWASQYACGLNCKFPPGTAGEAQRKADASCKPYIAMCNVSNGKVTYEVFGANHKCRGHVDECDNPVAYPDCKEDPKQCNESCSTNADCDTGLTCDSTSNTCRNPSCTTSENCTCPDGDVICNNLTCSSDDLELGKSYTFTCNASVTGGKKIETYDFRYKKDNDDWTALSASAVDSNISSELFIGDPGSYVVECRACEEKNNKDKCTPYQITTAD